MRFLVEIPHSYLTEVTWVVFVEVDTVVMLATSVTTTSRMLPVLSDTTMAVTDVASEFSGLT